MKITNKDFLKHDLLVNNPILQTFCKHAKHNQLNPTGTDRDRKTKKLIFNGSYRELVGVIKID